MNQKWQVHFSIIFMFAVLITTQSTGQDTNQNNNDRPEVAATVNGVEITIDQIDRDLSQTLQDIKLTPVQNTRAQKASLEKLINQRVAFEYLKKHDIAASESEVHLQLEELKTELETVEKTLADFLEQTNQTQSELEFQTAWHLSWKRYLEHKLTDEILEQHYRENKRKFDGTKLRVAHLLLKIPPNATPEQRKQIQEKANSISEAMSETSRSFESFVKEHSEAPTKDAGGEIGWIGLEGPMPTSFTQAAFKLSLGEVSKPVTTNFGVHLILCMEVQEGELTQVDVIDQVKSSASKAYFEAIAKKHRSDVDVSYGKRFDE